MFDWKDILITNIQCTLIPNVFDKKSEVLCMFGPGYWRHNNMHHMDSSLLRLCKMSGKRKEGALDGKEMVRAMNRKGNEDGELSF